MARDGSATNPLLNDAASDLVTVLDGLAPELNGLMEGEVRFLTVLPPGPVPVGVPEAEVERVVLALVARMRRCIENGGWMLAGVDRTTLLDADAAPLGLAAGDYAMLRIAARFEELARTPPLVKLAAAAADSMADGLGGRTLRALAARHAGAIQIEAVPGAGITATLFLRSAQGVRRQLVGGDPQR